MPRHTIKLSQEELKVVNIIKAVKELKSIDKAISYTIKEYSKSNSYNKLIQEIRGVK